MAGFWRWYDRAARLEFGGKLLDFVFDWKGWLVWFLGGGGGGGVTFLWAAIDGRSPLDVWLAALIAAAAGMTLVYFSISTLEKRRRRSQVKLSPYSPEHSSKQPSTQSLPNVRVADCPRVAALFEGDQRDKLFPLMESERLMVWARSMKGDDNLLQVPGKTWRSHFFMHLPKQAEDMQNQTFIKTQSGQQSIWFDVHFNQEQVEAFWPELEWIPVLTAARIAYEAFEQDGIQEIISSPKVSLEAKLTFIVNMMVNHNADRIQLRGCSAPSTVSRPIPDEERKRLHNVTNTNTLAPIWPGDAARYENVEIIRASLNDYIAWLRDLARRQI